MTDTITASLEAEHTECLADEELRNRAAQAAPICKERFESARGYADFKMAETSQAGGSEAHWRNSGGKDAYANELMWQRRYLMLNALANGKPDFFSVGYFVRDDIEAAVKATLDTRRKS